MPTEIEEAKAPASQPLLPKWANAQDGWCRAIVADVLKNGIQASDLDIDRYLKQFLSEKKLSQEPFEDVPKIEEQQPDTSPLDSVRLDAVTYAVDGRIGIGQDGSINGFMARSQTPDLRGNEYAYGLNSAYSSQAWEASLSYSEVAENFNLEVGFLTRTEFRSVGGRVQYAYRPEDFFGLHELRPHVGFNGFWDFEGFQETGRTHIDNHWEWPDGTEVHTGMNITREGVVDSFEIFPDVVVPPGTGVGARIETGTPRSQPPVLHRPTA